jgi:hypothetical protein
MNGNIIKPVLRTVLFSLLTIFGNLLDFSCQPGTSGPSFSDYTLTHAPTVVPTNTPCGFPGNTCTFTHTPLPPTATPTLCNVPSTQGNMSVGLSPGSTGNTLFTSPITITSSTAAVSISLFLGSSVLAGQAYAGIYSNIVTNGNNYPGTLLVQSGPQSVVANWNGFPTARTDLPASGNTIYWAAFVFSATEPISMTSGSGEYINAISNLYGLLPNTFPSANTPVAIQPAYYISTCP